VEGGGGRKKMRLDRVWEEEGVGKRCHSIYVVWGEGRERKMISPKGGGEEEVVERSREWV